MREDLQLPVTVNVKRGVLWLGGATVCFHLAYSQPTLGFLILFYPFALVRAVPHLNPRTAFYGGLLLGLLLYGPQLEFFWNLFHSAAILLWLILGFWLALFLLLARLSVQTLPPLGSTIALPILWIGLEYVRSELYPLKFSWANAGYPLGLSPVRPLLCFLGMYGVGALSAGAGSASLLAREHRVKAMGCLTACVGLAVFGTWAVHPPSRTSASVQVAGMQLEEAQEQDLPRHLDTLLSRHPQTELVVLHEYLISGEPSREIAAWCRRNQRWLIIGGRRELAGDLWQNTAFVVDPQGAVVFEQGKKTPIQFFQDGIAAPHQKVWHSPWGEIGIAICYDLSYTRVMDELVRQGAQALIIPTMDALAWGSKEHTLHSLVAPTRAAEYGLPIVRVASSGISQIVDKFGSIQSTAPFPGQEASLAGTLMIAGRGHLPIDRFLGPAAALLSALLPLWFWFARKSAGSKLRFDVRKD